MIVYVSNFTIDMYRIKIVNLLQWIHIWWDKDEVKNKPNQRIGYMAAIYARRSILKFKYQNFFNV